MWVGRRVIAATHWDGVRREDRNKTDYSQALPVTVEGKICYSDIAWCHGSYIFTPDISVCGVKCNVHCHTMMPWHHAIMKCLIFTPWHIDKITSWHRTRRFRCLLASDRARDMILRDQKAIHRCDQYFIFPYYLPLSTFQECLVIYWRIYFGLSVRACICSTVFGLLNSCWPTHKHINRCHTL